VTDKRVFHAVAHPEGDGYWVELTDLPSGCAGATQGRTLAEAHSMAVEAVALLLDVPEDSITVELTEGGAGDA